MKNIRDICIGFFKNEELRNDVKEILKPFFNMVYSEMYIYLWIIAIYNIFFGIVILAMFVILFRIFNDIKNMRSANNISI